MDKKIARLQKESDDIKNADAYKGVEEVWSGGQDGVDTSGLEIAQKLKIKTGGYMPKNYETISQGKGSRYPEGSTSEQKAFIDRVAKEGEKYRSDEQALRDLSKKRTLWGWTSEPIDPSTGKPFTRAENQQRMGERFKEWDAEVKLYNKYGGDDGMKKFESHILEKDSAIKGGADFDAGNEGRMRANKFGLKEDKGGYKSRTLRNAKETDATVYYGKTDGKGNPTSGGGKATLEGAKAANKPIIINPTESELSQFLIKHKVKKLNVAGSRDGDSRVSSLESALVQTSGAYKADIWSQSLNEVNTILRAKAMKATKDIVSKQQERNYKTIGSEPSSKGPGMSGVSEAIGQPTNKVDELLDVIGEGRDIGPFELKKWYRKYVKENHDDTFKRTYGRDKTSADKIEFNLKKDAYEQLMRGVKTEDRAASKKMNKTVYRFDETISKQFKARSERGDSSTIPESESSFNLDSFYEMQNIILRKRDDLQARARKLQELDNLKSERENVASMTTWEGNPSNKFNVSNYSPSEQLIELEYKQSKLGKDLDMILRR